MNILKTIQTLPARFVFIAVFVVICGMLGFGFYLQLVEGIEPCPMCIMQRYAFVLVALLALIGAALNPKKWTRHLWSLGMCLAAIAGGSVSVRQIWLQHNPPTVSTCGPSLNYMLDRFPLAEVLPKLFHGEGDCSEVTWTFLSLSIAEWALIAFVAVTLTGLWLSARRLKQQ